MAIAGRRRVPAGFTNVTYRTVGPIASIASQPELTVFRPEQPCLPFLPTRTMTGAGMRSAPRYHLAYRAGCAAPNCCTRSREPARPLVFGCLGPIPLPVLLGDCRRSSEDSPLITDHCLTTVHIVTRHAVKSPPTATAPSGARFRLGPAAHGPRKDCRTMTYDFTSIMNRHGMDSIAVDGLGTDPGFAPDPPREGFDVIPMWVADMNFPTVPTIPQAIIERAKHPAYGYFSPTDDYYSSIIDWQSTRNGVTGLTREAIGYENGVLGGVISTLTAFAARRRRAAAQPNLHRVHPEHRKQRLPHRPQSAHAGRARRMAHGLRGYGQEAQGASHPRGRVLQPSQSLRARVGALGNREGHGSVQGQRLRGHFRRDLVRFDSGESPAHPHPVGQRGRTQ